MCKKIEERERRRGIMWEFHGINMLRKRRDYFMLIHPLAHKCFHLRNSAHDCCLAASISDDQFGVAAAAACRIWFNALSSCMNFVWVSECLWSFKEFMYGNSSFWKEFFLTHLRATPQQSEKCFAFIGLLMAFIAIICVVLQQPLKATHKCETQKAFIHSFI